MAMSRNEKRLWEALSELHTLCLGLLLPPHADAIMDQAQAALAITGPDTDEDILRTLHWPWEDHGHAWAVTLTFLDYRRKLRKPIRDHRSLQLTLKKFAGLREADYVMAIEETISNGWQGVFPPKDPKKPKGVGMSSAELRKLGVSR